MLLRYVRAGLAMLALIVAAGCTVEAPFDPATVFGPLEDFVSGVQESYTNFVGDPFDSRPFPTLLGGDSQRVFYATDLGDIRITFPGPTNDIVLPGLLGPSNVYKIEDDKRELVQPLVVGGAVTGLATDGDVIAYVFIPDQESPGTHRVVAGSLASGSDQILYEAVVGTEVILPPLTVSGNRVAFAVLNTQTSRSALHVIDVSTPPAAPLTIDLGVAESFDLRGTRLVYAVTETDTGAQIVLRDLNTAAETTLATGVKAPTDGLPVFLTDNKVVWGEWAGDELSRVVAYSIPTATQTVWMDAVSGDLAGASDEFFVTQGYANRAAGQADFILIQRYALDGQSKEIARFRADGLAGQAHIYGDRIVFVNPGRRIVLVPLIGAGRQSFAPY